MASVSELGHSLLNTQHIHQNYFPFTGNTWMHELVFLITTNGDVEAAMKSKTNERVPNLEITFPSQPSGYDIIMKRPSPRLMATHLNFKFFAKSLQQAKSKFIVVKREPKDCLVSFFHNYRDIIGYNGSFDDFFDMYRQEELFFGNPIDHAISWWANKDKDNFLFTTYEEMKEDIRGVIRKVAAFLNKELSDDTVEKIVEHTSFEKMKANPMANRSEIVENFIRKGIVGDWVNHMNEDQRALVDCRVKEACEKYAITF